MSIDTRNLSGARASSAVRCIAKAQHEALGTPRDDENQAWLEKHFRRGVNVGRAWASSAAALIPGAILEAEVPWGPEEYGWVGHVDLLDPNAKRVYEAYHAAGGAFREEKALQAAFYADALGPEWTAELAVIDTTDVSDEEGFAVQPYEINVDGLRARVRDIKARVIAAVEAGAVNMEDRVGESPMHAECRDCPFKAACWSEWRAPHPADVEGMEDAFVALRLTDADRKATAASLKRIEDRRKELIEQISEVFPDTGGSVTCGDVTVKRIPVKGSLSFSLTDAIKAGYALPVELEAFAKPRKGFDKWEVVQ